MKTLVNIITEDNPIPGYLFVKELYEDGDSVMLISAKDTEDDLDHMSDIIGVPSSMIEEIVLKNDIDEFRYELICRTIKKYLKEGVYYVVNLAGGTRYLALAVQQVFEGYNSDFFYTNVEDNQIIKSKFDDRIYNNDDYGYDIKHRMTVTEYLDIHDLEHDLVRQSMVPVLSFELAQKMFEVYVGQVLTKRERKTIEVLRNCYRNQERAEFSELFHPTEPGNLAAPAIRSVLKKIDFTPANKAYLTKAEVEWITGGWFEEYIYYIVQKAIVPDDIVLGIHIWEEGVRRNNELDVCFIKNNKLFVIECKTGIHTQQLFNTVVYKACALKEALLGISCSSYIFTLKDDDRDVLARIAENMDIKLIDKEIILDEQKMNLVWSEMKIISNDIS